MPDLMPVRDGLWLLLGGSGQIGNALLPLLTAAGFQVVAPTRAELDLTDAATVSGYLGDLQPLGIINAAAYTAVDRAETEPALAFALNATLPALLAQYSAQHQIRFVHYSSDYVYGDDGTRLLHELLPLAPQSVYAQSKAAADQAVLAADPAALVLRTSWVYAATGQNFMRTMLQLFRQKSQLQVVADQIGAPTPASLVAEVSLQLLLQPVSGVLNLASRGYCSWQQFALAILVLAEQHGVSGLCCQQIEPIPAAAWPAAARRPLNSRLDLTALERQLGQPLPDWQQGLAYTFAHWLRLQPELHSIHTTEQPESLCNFNH